MLTGDLLDRPFPRADERPTMGMRKFLAMNALFEMLVACCAFVNFCVLIADGSLVFESTTAVPGNRDSEDGIPPRTAFERDSGPGCFKTFVKLRAGTFGF